MKYIQYIYFYSRILILWTIPVSVLKIRWIREIFKWKLRLWISVVAGGGGRGGGTGCMGTPNLKIKIKISVILTYLTDFTSKWSMGPARDLKWPQTSCLTLVHSPPPPLPFPTTVLWILLSFDQTRIVHVHGNQCSIIKIINWMIDSRSKATVGSEANIPGKHRHYFDYTCPTSIAQ